MYYHPSFNPDEIDQKAWDFLRKELAVSTQPNKYTTLAMRAKYYFLHFQVGSILTHYLKILEDLTEHLVTNFYTALIPETTEDLIDPVLQILNNQGSNLTDDKYRKLAFMTFDKLLKSDAVCKKDANVERRSDKDK